MVCEPDDPCLSILAGTRVISIQYMAILIPFVYKEKLMLFIGNNTIPTISPTG